VTPDGLDLWPVCGPVLSVHVLRIAPRPEAAWPRITAT